MAPEGGFFGGQPLASGSSGSAGSGNIRVFVCWHEPTVFSGEDVRCRITFRNVAPKPTTARPAPSYEPAAPPLPALMQPFQPQQQQQPKSRPPPTPTSFSSPSHSLAPPASASTGTRGRGHQRASLSLSGPAVSSPSLVARGHGHSHSQSQSQGPGQGAGPGRGHQHRRSLSIMSLSSTGAPPSSPGSTTPGLGATSVPGSPSAPSSQRPMARGHTRAASLQIGPRGSLMGSSPNGNGLPATSPGGPRSATQSRGFSGPQPSPLFNAAFPPSASRSGSISQASHHNHHSHHTHHTHRFSSGARSPASASSTAPNTPGLGGLGVSSPRPMPDGLPEWKFPVTSPKSSTTSFSSPDEKAEKPLPALPLPSPAPPTSSSAAVPTIYETSQPHQPETARVLATTSIAGTPRSSGEFYSLSNHSSETLASEYVGGPLMGPASVTPAGRPPGSGAGGPSARPLIPHARQKSSANLLYPPLQPHRTRAAAAAAVAANAAANAAAAAAMAPETLMMGYAQIQGSFTLDGSLVDLAPFELVKRKGVVGGQGGGVIGVETMSGRATSSRGRPSTDGERRDSGLLRGLGSSLGSFGWGSITSSLGELLGGGEMSTMRELRDLASAKTVPLLSTPQTVLFVDLQLAPGESRSFEYVFRLPRGLPPSHRGKLMKISYGLVIGTQRAATSFAAPSIYGGGIMPTSPPSAGSGSSRDQQQRVRSVEVPFRVLGSVNSHGEILGHDLMSPYILLRDQARVQQLPPSSSSSSSDKTLAPRSRRRSASTADPAATMDGFLTYVDELLQSRGGIGANGAHGVKTNGVRKVHSNERLTSSRRASVASSTYYDGPTPAPLVLSAREAIDLAILRSNVADSRFAGGSGLLSANRFEIARNGRRVGTVLLARPAYRLGEAVTLAVDFANAAMPCYAVHASLETAERIADPALALRSEASVQRATRRVYAASSEATLYARRFVFTPTLPATATPEFVTSAVALEWKIRLEFVVPVGGEADTEAAPPPPSSASQDSLVSSASASTASQDQTTPRAATHPRAAHSSVPLLEEVARDDRGGLVLVAAETLACESFEAAVPLRVYGWSSGDGGSDFEAEPLGLVV